MFCFQGKICAACNEVIHKHCVEKHLSRKNCCPICKKKWVEAEERHYDEPDSDEDEDRDESMDTE